jgi:hypothetical protein
MGWDETLTKLEKMLIANRFEVNPKMKVIAIPGTRVIYHTRTPLVKSYLIPI